jgi:hypothetical protein
VNIIALLPKIFLAIAICLVIWQARKLLLAMASNEWKQTKGTVLKAYVDESATYDEDGIGDDVTHSVHVRYTYKIGSRRFESTRLTYRPTFGLVFSEAVDLLHGITQGKEVDVFYDPRCPERAVLVPGSSTDNVVHLALSFVFLAVVLWQLLR